MTKSEIIDNMATVAGITKAQAAKALTVFQNSVTTALKEDGKLQLHGFGTFKKTFRAARQAHDPRNPGGPKIPVAAKWGVTFKPASDFRERLGRVVAPKK